MEVGFGWDALDFLLMHIVSLSFISYSFYICIYNWTCISIHICISWWCISSPEDKNCINPKLLINPLAAGLKWGGQPVNIKPLPHLRDSCHFNYHLCLIFGIFAFICFWFLPLLLSSAPNFRHFCLHWLFLHRIFFCCLIAHVDRFDSSRWVMTHSPIHFSAQECNISTFSYIFTILLKILYKVHVKLWLSWSIFWRRTKILLEIPWLVIMIIFKV